MVAGVGEYSLEVFTGPSKPAIPGSNPGGRTNTYSSGALTIEGIFKSSGLETSEMIDVHGYSKRLKSARRRLAQLRHSDLLLAFVDHLLAFS